MAGNKLFLALQAGTEAARIARVVEAEHAARHLPARLRPSSIFHVTLHYFGEFAGEPDPQLVDLACRAASELNHPSFDLGFDRFESWGGQGVERHPFVLTGGQVLEPVRELRDALAARLAAHGVKAEKKAYRPHLTLRYDKRPAPVWAVDLPGWVASEFVLIKSPQGETRHDVIARWPLQG